MSPSPSSRLRRSVALSITRSAPACVCWPLSWSPRRCPAGEPQRHGELVLSAVVGRRQIARRHHLQPEVGEPLGNDRAGKAQSLVGVLIAQELELVRARNRRSAGVRPAPARVRPRAWRAAGRSGSAAPGASRRHRRDWSASGRSQMSPCRTCTCAQARALELGARVREHGRAEIEPDARGDTRVANSSSMRPVPVPRSTSRSNGPGPSAADTAASTSASAACRARIRSQSPAWAWK